MGLLAGVQRKAWTLWYFQGKSLEDFKQRSDKMWLMLKTILLAAAQRDGLWAGAQVGGSRDWPGGCYKVLY